MKLKSITKRIQIRPLLSIGLLIVVLSATAYLAYLNRTKADWYYDWSNPYGVYAFNYAYNKGAPQTFVGIAGGLEDTYNNIAKRYFNRLHQDIEDMSYGRANLPGDSINCLEHSASPEPCMSGVKEYAKSMIEKQADETFTGWWPMYSTIEEMLHEARLETAYTINPRPMWYPAYVISNNNDISFPHTTLYLGAYNKGVNYYGIELRTNFTTIPINYCAASQSKYYMPQPIIPPSIIQSSEFIPPDMVDRTKVKCFDGMYTFSALQKDQLTKIDPAKPLVFIEVNLSFDHFNKNATQIINRTEVPLEEFLKWINYDGFLTKVWMKYY